MKKLSILLFSFFALICGMSAQTTLYAYRNYQKGAPNGGLNGPVKFKSNNPMNLQLIADQSKLGQSYAGAYYNYKWYAQITKPGTSSANEGLYTIDLNTGERTLISTKGDALADMTYDYSNNIMYGIKAGNKYLMTINLKTGVTANVGQFKNESGSFLYILALACNTDGKMYGVATDNNFYLVDKTNAKCKLIGGTGAEPAYTQTMDFDRNTGVLYWVNNGDDRFYTIDIKTGKATLVGLLGRGGGDSLSSLFAEYIHVPVGAPDRVTERSTKVTGKNVTISWVNPVIDAQKKNLTELTAVKILRNGTLLETISVEENSYGKTMSFTDNNLADGLYQYSIVPVNSKGEGGVETDKLQVRIGNDAPGAVRNLTIKAGDSKAILTWDAPNQGKNGGDFDPSSIKKYVVMRYFGNNITPKEITDPGITTYTDVLSFGTYSYSVFAVNEVGKGNEVRTEPTMIKPADWLIMTTDDVVLESNKEYKFYDFGGPSMNYRNELNDLLIMRPKSPKGAVCVKFTDFDIDNYEDSLIIYNGAGVNAPVIGKFNGKSVPSDLVSLKSTSLDGALTFRFVSDVIASKSGWSANVSVLERKDNDLTAGRINGELFPAVNSQNEYIFKVFNDGVNSVKGNDYIVRLVNKESKEVLAEANGVDIAASQTKQITLNYKPLESKDIKVVAEINFAADEDKTNNTSEEIVISVIPEGSKFIKCGKSDGKVAVTPISYMTKETISEIIYFKEELGIPSGKLQMIGYTYAAIGTKYINTPIKVWVGETDKNDLSEGSIPANNLTLVYDGTVDAIPGNMNLSIKLQNPYDYKGGNLVVLVYKPNNGSNTSYDIQYVGTSGNFKVDPLRSRFDSVFFDDNPALDPNGNFGDDATPIWPLTKFLFTDIASAELTDKDNSTVEVYPNPVVDVLNIQGEVDKLELVNNSGQLIYGAEGISSIDMTSYPSGVYFLKVVDNDGRLVVEKIIKK